MQLEVSSARDKERKISLGLGIFVCLILGYFFGLHRAFLLGKSAIGYWVSSWNASTEYEHAFLVPPIMAWAVWKNRLRIAAASRQPPGRGHWVGLATILVGVGLFVLGVRAIQWRLAIFGLTAIILGTVFYVWGWAMIRAIWFPVLLIFFTIPMPGIMQATNSLQLMATKAAYHASRIVGVDLSIAGNDMASATGKWGFEVSEGCSGLRSLIALVLVATVYAYATQKSLAKGLILVAASVPLAIIANSIRITTIVIIAEYINAKFAGGVYHDWAGFVYFILVGLAGLIAVHKLIDGRKTVVSRRMVKLPTTSGSLP